MSLELSILSNIRQIEKRLTKETNSAKAKATSIAAEKAVAAAASTLVKTGQRSLDNPIPAIFNGKKSRNRVGWIYWQWDNKADVKRKKGDVNAFVQIQGKGPLSARQEQQEALHRQIYGTTETRGVTPQIPYIIRPSKNLRRQKKIKGVPFVKIDKFGNLRNYRGMMNKVSNDPRFFHVGLNDQGGGNNNNGLKLKPGLYFRKTRIRKYKRHRITKRKGGPYGDAKTRETVNIITVLRYQRIRDYNRKWDFKPEAVKTMQRTYKRAFLVYLQRELQNERRRRPSAKPEPVGRLV